MTEHTWAALFDRAPEGVTVADVRAALDARRADRAVDPEGDSDREENGSDGDGNGAGDGNGSGAGDG